MDWIKNSGASSVNLQLAWPHIILTMTGVLGWPNSNTADAFSMEQYGSNRIDFHVICDPWNKNTEMNETMLCWSFYLGY